MLFYWVSVNLFFIFMNVNNGYLKILNVVIQDQYFKPINLN